MKQKTIFNESGMPGNNPMFEANGVKGNNPLYGDKGSSGENPLFGQRTGRGGGDVICGSTAHFLVVLMNVPDGKPIAETKTDSCGNFWFPNMPAGNYAVKISGTGVNQKMNITQGGTHECSGTGLQYHKEQP